ncbi:hypothetical protein AYI70_g227 [Smittium culicis]|uniref:Uncharacterized protein n=1 Tax=Smittium culicis TaxID=133412 RepID=A0A1R1YHT2_9FUNG|nr:hypothetical protein AYI70_g227 [Smittium culicis]
MGNVELALKYYLKAVELCRDNVLGFYGVKLCTSRLISTLKKSDSLKYYSKNSSAAKKSSNTEPAKTETVKHSLDRLLSLEKLATERLLHVYSNPESSLIKHSQSMAVSNDGNPLKPTEMTKRVLEDWLKSQS